MRASLSQAINKVTLHIMVFKRELRTNRKLNHLSLPRGQTGDRQLVDTCKHASLPDFRYLALIRFSSSTDKVSTYTDC